MRRFATSITIVGLMLMLALLSACGTKEKTASPPASAAPASPAAGAASPAASASPAPSVAVVKDDYGREVKLPLKPQRLIAPGFEDPLLVLGMKPVAQYALGTAVKTYLQQWLSDVPPLDYTGGLKPEPVLALNPDLIILSNSGWLKPEMFDTFGKISPTYIFNEEATSTEKWSNNWRKTLLKFGELFGKKDVAEKAIAEYEQKAKDAKARLQATVGGKKVAILYLSGKTLGMMGTGWWNSAPVLYEDLGLAAPEIAKGKSYETLSTEAIAKLDADYIFFIVTDPNEDLNKNPLLDNALWRDHPAVKTGHVFKVSRDGSFFGSGPTTNKLTIDAVLKALAP
ncbi:MAG: ABC transporter substrate-binding protein [Paenibacillaceae bacterium]|nr:ABC transporter substrate-binding protein [Paenibacillaceae bacterium]